MSDHIKISVDGQHGVIAARNGGIRFVGAHDEMALARLGGINRNGRPGEDVVQAIPGAPAGFLAVELSESNDVLEGIHVDVIRSESRQEPPSYVEIPAGRDVLFTAIGGDGESGHMGGNGQNGMDGIAGAPATRDTDATAGTDGGNGGDAGRGVNGADGGHGGEIQVYIDEENTHLLLASHDDTSGGKGGAPGSHGKPGRGGRGGIGGAGYRWQEPVGYTFSCTSSCIGRSNTSTTTSLVRAGTRAGSTAMALVTHQRAQAVEGGNLQAMIALVASRYGAMRHARADPGNCHCSGGHGNCIGCKSSPISKDFERVKGQRGLDGQPGASITDPLFEGIPGQEGSVTIIVRYGDGREQAYSSRYNLELVDFDVEDENGDGIFEPGEHIIVKRIRVRNTGGMPSPTCHIPISIVPSDWFIPLANHHGYAFIPSSIQTGTTVTLEGSIKALIRRNEGRRLSGKLFLENDVLSIKATMPWLNRELPNFDFRRTVTVQYPIELGNFHHLTSQAQGSRSIFSWEIFNKSLKTLGSGTDSARSIEVDISISADFGRLLSTEDTWEDRVVQQIPTVSPKSVTDIQQSLHILPNAEPYTHIPLQIQLYISVPGQEYLVDEDVPVEICLIQEHELRIQVSSHHAFNPRSSILVVTNAETTSNRVQAIRKFIDNEMNLDMDEWNVGLYGGFQFRPDGESASSVLTAYYGKTVIFLGNKFAFFGSNPRSIVELCDIRALADACMNGTACIFLGSLGDSAYTSLADALVFPVSSKAVDVDVQTTASTGFLTARDLIISIQQEKLVGSPKFSLYTVPIKTRWYRLGKANPESEARKLCNRMRRAFPQERFLVTPIGLISSAGRLAVLHGSSHRLPVTATEEQQNINRTYVNLLCGEDNEQRNEAAPKNQLSPFESYVMVASLPISRRVDMAWKPPVFYTDGIASSCSEFVLKAISFSLLRDMNREIRTFLHRPAWPNQIPLPIIGQDSDDILRLHFPVLAKVLMSRHATTATQPPSESIIELLQHAEASCLPQKKRHMARKILVPWGQRRTQLRQFVVRITDELLTRKGFTSPAIHEFHSHARALHSITHRDKRNINKIIIRRVSKFTQRSEHGFQQSQKGTTDLVPETISCSNTQWDARYAAIESSTAQMNADTEKAWQALGNMTLEM